MTPSTLPTWCMVTVLILLKRSGKKFVLNFKNHVTKHVSHGNQRFYIHGHGHGQFLQGTRSEKQQLLA